MPLLFLRQEVRKDKRPAGLLLLLLLLAALPFEVESGNAVGPIEACSTFESDFEELDWPEKIISKRRNKYISKLEVPNKSWAIPYYSDGVLPNFQVG